MASVIRTWCLSWGLATLALLSIGFEKHSLRDPISHIVSVHNTVSLPSRVAGAAFNRRDQPGPLLARPVARDRPQL